MLPPGHLAAGYLVAETVIKLAPYNLTAVQQNNLALLGLFFGILPDFDFIYAFYKTGKIRINNSKISHRIFPTHTPFFWLVAAAAIFFTANSPFQKELGLIIWLSTWGHFILDSEWGIMWLWPLRKKLYPFSEKFYQSKYAQDFVSQNENFFQYWLGVIKRQYITEKSAYFEIALIFLALLVLLK